MEDDLVGFVNLRLTSISVEKRREKKDIELKNGGWRMKLSI